MSSRTETAEGPAPTRDGVTRRDFLRAGALGTIGLTRPGLLGLEAAGAVRPGSDEKSCILIFNLGGPSHLDLFDPKPDAPEEIRGPFKAIRTVSPDIQLTELLPLHAKVADKFSLVRTCHHPAGADAAVHDVGHRVMQTGRAFADRFDAPHVGCVVEFLEGSRNGLPAHVVLPQATGPTGGNAPHGQDAGFLGEEYDPFVLNADPSWNDFTSRRAREAFELSREPQVMRERYGPTRFGRCCLLARRLVEAGVRFVTINTFTTVYDAFSWDVHGFKPFTTLAQMKETVCPAYDQGYSALIEDLSQRGLLDQTLVCNLAEFGRTPRINPAGGRDHWPQCWTVGFAGGGVRGGRVVGRSDAHGAYPVDRPITPAEVVATIYHALGIDHTTELHGPNGRPFPLVEPGYGPIAELF